MKTGTIQVRTFKDLLVWQKAFELVVPGCYHNGTKSSECWMR